MVKKEEFRAAAKLAVQNLIKHGDTDIFPLTFEGHAIYDSPDKFVDLICEYEANLEVVREIWTAEISGISA
ncbi:hypothetical protein [Brucella pituitosa]|uniref:hypothetical protein n=1 Tax=Brucella pituitosa TaxID=571256 RepID=UPI003F4AAE5C